MDTQKLKHPQLLVMGCALGLMVSIAPIYLSSFAIFLTPLSTEFGWSRGQLSTIFALTALSIALASPLYGYLIRHYGIRRILTICIILFSILIACISQAPDSYPIYIILSAMVGIAGAGTNTFVYVSVLPQWFSGRLGLVLGLAMTGIGIGQTISPVLSQFLITEFGWRNAYLALSLFPVVIGLPCALFLIKERPSPPTDKVHQTESTSSARSSLVSLKFWLFCISFLAVAVIAAGLGLHGVPLMLDRGITPMQAASLAATSGISVFFARLVCGALLDYIGPKGVGTLVFSAATAGAFAFTTYAPDYFIYAAPVLIGIALGAEGDLMPYVVRRYFGMQDYSVLYAWMFMAFNFGVILGPASIGAYYDTTGTYDGILVSYMIFCAAAFVIFLIASNSADFTDSESG